MTDLKSALIYPADAVRRFMEAGYWTDDIPHQVLAARAERTPEARALIGPHATLTYAELNRRARGFAAGLLAQGLKRGDVIGFQLPNIPEFFVAYLGAQIMGAVPCMFHMPYRSGELEPLVAHVRPKALICMPAMEKYDAPSLMKDLCKKTPSIGRIIVIGKIAPDGCVAFEDLAATAPGTINDPPNADDPAIILFTSGTSSQPKAVVHSHRTLTASATHTGDRMGVTASDIVLCAPAHTHAFGLCIGVMILMKGAANALMPEYTPPALAETIKRAAATVVCCGPAHIQAGLKAGLWSAEFTQSIRRVFTGGALCPPDVLKSLEAALPNGRVFQIWGMTEVWMPIVHAPDASIDVRAASLGLPPIGHDARAVDSDGKIQSPGHDGELQMRGPFLLASYYNDPAATRGAFTEDGWFRTGDMVTIDSNGFIAITGRVKDIINRGGIKINPADIEAAMNTHPAVQMSAVVPISDELLGERACLFLQTAPGKIITLEQVREFLAANNIAKMRWPERLEIVEAMPMTATRKIIKRKLVEIIEGKP